MVSSAYWRWKTNKEVHTQEWFANYWVRRDWGDESFEEFMEFNCDSCDEDGSDIETPKEE
jgi:hypothetical protein